MGGTVRFRLERRLCQDISVATLKEEKDVLARFGPAKVPEMLNIGYNILEVILTRRRPSYFRSLINAITSLSSIWNSSSFYLIF